MQYATRGRKEPTGGWSRRANAGGAGWEETVHGSGRLLARLRDGSGLLAKDVLVVSKRRPRFHRGRSDVWREAANRFDAWVLRFPALDLVDRGHRNSGQLRQALQLLERQRRKGGSHVGGGGDDRKVHGREPYRNR